MIFNWFNWNICRNLITPLVSMIPACTCKAVACLDPWVYAINHPKYRYITCLEYTMQLYSTYAIFEIICILFKDWNCKSVCPGSVFMSRFRRTTHQRLPKNPQRLEDTNSLILLLQKYFKFIIFLNSVIFRPGQLKNAI